MKQIEYEGLVAKESLAKEAQLAKIKSEEEFQAQIKQ